VEAYSAVSVPAVSSLNTVPFPDASPSAVVVWFPCESRVSLAPSSSPSRSFRRVFVPAYVPSHASSLNRYCRAFCPDGPRLLRRCKTGPRVAMPGLVGIAGVTDASC
jgi:hypothetical protein